ncbi:MAG: hypothetical protein CL678_01910 [Bdellovibrionaceae bacterium]|nr:hypothetical protein [Pseudobdellovibrionaceae bacterium]
MQPTPLTIPFKTKMKYQIQIPFEILEKAYTIFATSFINRIVDDSKIADDYTKYFGDINRISNIFTNHLRDLLNDIKTQKISKKTVPKKPTIPVPFYGNIVDGWCKGIRKNHGLYTQCTKSPHNKEIYCKVCKKQANNNATGNPNCGNIYVRKNLWNNNLNYQPDGMSQEIPYANLMKKLGITRKQAEKEVLKLGWGAIPNSHFVEKQIKRGRPAKVVVSDSEEDVPKRKRGRPKKNKEVTPTDEELIAILCGTV